MISWHSKENFPKLFIGGRGNMTKFWTRFLTWVMIFLLLPPFEAMPQTASSASFSKEQIAQMVAPIALYPDSLVAQILMASTYPLEVVEADRWVKKNPNLKGDALNEALKDKSWDVSVKSLCHFPDVLSGMSQNLDQTSKLGDAVLSQQEDVMNAIQELRHQAQAAGNLKTTEQQQVIVDPADPQVIVIQPANPQVVYVPAYNPAVVYGSWAYPAYPPYAPWYYPAGAALVGGAIGFGIGYAVGSSSWGWSNCNWGHSNINVNVDRTNNFNRVNVGNRVGNQNWRHNVDHRRGVAYRDNATSQRFGQSPARSQEYRRSSRGYADSGLNRQNLQQRNFNQGGAQRQNQNFGQRGGTQGSFQSRGGGSRGSTFSRSGSGNFERRASQRGTASRSSSYGRGGGGNRGGGGRGGGGRRR
jgi:Protein of unknown function (DUF3300)